MISSEDMYDVAVIGGGVIGCAILRELTSQGYRCILLEQHSHLLTGASSGNSGMVHTGHDTSMTIAGVYEKRLYARSRDINVPYYESKSLPFYDCGDMYKTNSNSLEAKCLKRSVEFNNLHYGQHKLPFIKFGGIIVAMTKSEVDKLPALVVAAHRNGVTGVRQITREDVIRMEPHINKAVLGGIFVPGECVVDPFLTPITMLHEATRSGAHVRVDSKVEDGKYLDDTWVLQTRNGIVKARVVVNAAGLYGDQVENMCRPSRFTIKPGKGEAVVYPKDAKKLINHMILQIPTPKTKGIIIYPTVYGNVIIGPTLEYVTDREIPPENPKVIETLVKFGHRIIPSLKEYKPIGSVVGLRPGTEQRDYHLEALPDKRWVTVGGIRATGLTNCLSIAEYVSHEIINTIGVSPSRNKPASPGKATWWKTNKGTIVMDGIEYTVTHPITKFGLWDTAKSAQLLKSKL